MNYFAYGSNMSQRRLRQRTPGVRLLGICRLQYHVLRFHKIGADSSGKCDAHFTGLEPDEMHGVLYQIDELEKQRLDRIEGLGFGYEEKIVTVQDDSGSLVRAVTYTATRIDVDLAPYHWYHRHVITGAREVGLPPSYIERIGSVASVEDQDARRSSRELSIYRLA